MKKLLLIFFIISQYTFAQLVVHSKNDTRLIAYIDSVKCYLHGLNEIRIAKSIMNKNDTAIGRFYKNFIEKESDKINPDIKPIAQMNQYSVLFKLRPLSEEYDSYTVISLEETRWIPEIWKKPVVKVVYEEIKKEKPKKLIASKDTIKKKSITYRYEFRINGKQVTEETFEKFYGSKVLTANYCELKKMANKKNKSNGLASKN